MQNWESDKDIITQKYLELINQCNIELSRTINANQEESRQILPLITFILARLETVSELAITGKLWDAEIIYRSALETLVKLMFITTAENDERDIRLDEYWNKLSEINSLKMSEQAKRNLRFFDEEIFVMAYQPLILPEELESELREKWTKKERQKVEQKWSFTEMINQISHKSKGTPLEMILALGHGYRLASHVTHGDEMGISLINERKSRTQEEQLKAHAGHYLRMLSDCLTFCGFIGLETMGFLNLPEKKKFFLDTVRRISEVSELEDKYKGRVFDDPDYDKYRDQK